MQYGEIVEFECHVPSYRNYSLDIIVGQRAKVYPYLNNNGREFSQRLHPGEFYANFTQLDDGTGKGIFGVVINSKTLQLMEYMWCRAYNNVTHVDSNIGRIINVTYPDTVECNTTTTITPSRTTYYLTPSSTSMPTPSPAIIVNQTPNDGAEQKNVTSILLITSLLLYSLLCIDL